MVTDSPHKDLESRRGLGFLKNLARARTPRRARAAMASPRVNAAVVVMMLAWFLHRLRSIGPAAALAEAAGLSDMYERYLHRYSPLHAEIFSSAPLSWWLDERLSSALSLHNTSRRTAALLALVEHHGHGVYSLPLLKPEVARTLAQECTHYRQSGRNLRPNSMNEYGVALGPEGLEGLEYLLRPLRDDVLTPLSSALYSSGSDSSASVGALHPLQSAASQAADAASAGHCCSAHHAFVVSYNVSTQADLDMHHDASDVTLNVCLEIDADPGAVDPDAVGSDWRAADAPRGSALPHPPDDGHAPWGAASFSKLQFCGFVGDQAHRRTTVALRHAVGRAVIHLGRHRHGASKTMAGSRQNLILWGRTHTSASAGSGWKAGQAVRLHPAELPPHPECLSWTFDPDFERFRELPPAALAAREKRRVEDELMDLARRATDEHIAKLPENHQPIVRALRHAAQQQAASAAAATSQSDNTDQGMSHFMEASAAPAHAERQPSTLEEVD
jgi:hypothetical protein